MAPKTRITQQMILDAACDIVRYQGHEELNVRTIAEHLGCSTQPILYNFRTMEELRGEVSKMADAFHTAYIMTGADNSEDPLLSIGLNYIRFGQEEPRFFRFLFQTNRLGGMDLTGLLNDPQLEPLLAVSAASLGCGMEQVKEKFLTLFVTVHGYASLLANNAMEYDEDQAVGILTAVYNGLMEK